MGLDRAGGLEHDRTAAFRATTRLQCRRSVSRRCPTADSVSPPMRFKLSQYVTGQALAVDRMIRHYRRQVPNIVGLSGGVFRPWSTSTCPLVLGPVTSTNSPS